VGLPFVLVQFFKGGQDKNEIEAKLQAEAKEVIKKQKEAIDEEKELLEEEKKLLHEEKESLDEEKELIHEEKESLEVEKASLNFIAASEEYSNYRENAVRTPLLNFAALFGIFIAIGDGVADLAYLHARFLVSRLTMPARYYS
jgi:hypothetical protein